MRGRQGVQLQVDGLIVGRNARVANVHCSTCPLTGMLRVRKLIAAARLSNRNSRAAAQDDRLRRTYAVSVVFCLHAK